MCRSCISLLEATASGYAAVDSYEIDLNREGREPRRLVLNAQKLDYGNGESIRLLVSVSDVTDARIAEKLADDMLKEKAVLLQELQHRIANSLQIIASVLLQSARKVHSDRDQKPSERRPQAGDVGRGPATAALPPPASRMSICGRTSSPCATASAHR